MSEYPSVLRLRVLRKKAPKRSSITKTVDTEYLLTRPRKGAKLKEEVWETEDGQIVSYSLAYIKSPNSWCGQWPGAWIRQTVTNTTIGTSWEQWRRLNLRAMKRYPGASTLKYTNCGEKRNEND
jgi:hypothetical protein